MAKLTVQATYRAFQLESTNKPVVVSISVTDDAGSPVEGLSENHVKVKTVFGPLVGGFPTPSLVLAQVVDAPNSGFYNVLVKSGSQMWEPGHYVVGLIVERKKLPGGLGVGSVESARPAPGPAPMVTDRGQTVAVFDVA